MRGAQLRQLRRQIRHLHRPASQSWSQLPGAIARPTVEINDIRLEPEIPAYPFGDVVDDHFADPTGLAQNVCDPRMKFGEVLDAFQGLLMSGEDSRAGSHHEPSGAALMVVQASVYQLAARRAPDGLFDRLAFVAEIFRLRLDPMSVVFPIVVDDRLQAVERLLRRRVARSRCATAAWRAGRRGTRPGGHGLEMGSCRIAIKSLRISESARRRPGATNPKSRGFSQPPLFIASGLRRND